MWKIMFSRLNVKLLYSTYYYFQTNDQFERINQTIEIVFRFLITTLNHSNRWSKTLSRIQREFNNFINNVVTFNEIIYDFISIQTMNLFTHTSILSNFFAKKLSLKNNRKIIRTKVSNAISFEQMQIKFYYDRKHQFFFMKKKRFRVHSITSWLQNRDYRHYWQKV